MLVYSARIGWIQKIANSFIAPCWIHTAVSKHIHGVLENIHAAQLFSVFIEFEIETFRSCPICYHMFI